MIRGLWDRETVALMLLASFVPLAAAWVWWGGFDAVVRLGLALAVSGAWHVVFMLARAQPPSFGGAVTALAVAMLAPADLGLFQFILGISFGVVMAELIFGGWGRNVLNPATVALAFLGFGFPAAAWPELLLPLGWAAIPAAAIGAASGVMSWRIIAGAGLTLWVASQVGAAAGATLPAAGVVLVLLVCDPVASASTAAGRWLNGILYAALVLLFAAHWDGGAPVQLAVSAALFTSLAAPVLDEAVISYWLARRGRHG